MSRFYARSLRTGTLSIVRFTVPGIGAITALLLMSAFFSSSETAIFTIPDDWIADQKSSSHPRSETLREPRADPHRLLVTILVGNNVVNVAIASLVTVLVSEFLPPGGAVTVATLTASFVVLVFGENLPKSYGLRNATRWGLVVARPIQMVERLCYPLVLLFDGITRRINRQLGGDLQIEKTNLDR